MHSEKYTAQESINSSILTLDTQRVIITRNENELDIATKMLDQEYPVKDINRLLDFIKLTELDLNRPDELNTFDALKSELKEILKNEKDIPLISEWMSNVPEETVNSILNEEEQQSLNVLLQKYFNSK